MLTSTDVLSEIINVDYLIDYLDNEPEEKPDEGKLLVDASEIEEYIDEKIPKATKQKYLDLIMSVMKAPDYEPFNFEGVNGEFYKPEDDEDIIFGYLMYEDADNQDTA